MWYYPALNRPVKANIIMTIHTIIMIAAAGITMMIIIINGRELILLMMSCQKTIRITAAVRIIPQISA